MKSLSNLNTDIALLMKEAMNALLKLRKETSAMEFSNSVYELPSTEKMVRWYHASAGYPLKATWLKAIKMGFYATWPMLTVKAVNKHFPDSAETAKRHTRIIKSGVQSTKDKTPVPEEINGTETLASSLQ